jgi:hypothetical protein
MVNNSPNIKKITSHLNSLSDGKQFHQYQQKSPLTSTRGDVCWYWWNCWPSLNELRWEVILLILVELLTITQWVEVRGDFGWYWWNCWPSLNELRWEVILTSHLNSLSDGQQFYQYQQKSPLTSTHWVMVNNSQYQQKSPLTLTHHHSMS